MSKEKLSEEQVYDVMKFSNALYGYLQNGVWSPQTQNDALIHLNNNQKEATYQDVIDALSRSLSNAEDIQGYSEFMNVFDTIYSKTLEYYSNILSFDLSWTCINAHGKDYQSEEYKADERRMMKFLDNFDYEREFKSKVVPQVLKTGIFYGWFRDSTGTINDTPLDDSDDISVKRTSKYSLQIMPQDKCKLTGYWDGGLLYDFNMDYFLSPTVDIQTYDPSLIKAFKRVFKNKKGMPINYEPHSQLVDRDGTYTTWIQTSPSDGAVVFKYDEGNFNVLPPLGNLMKATLDNTKIHQLQYDKDMASAWAILYGNIGLMDKEKSGQKPNQTSFTPEVMGKFMQLVQSSLKNIMKTVALPLENTRFGQFTDGNSDMEDDSLAVSAGQGAFSSPLIYDNSTSKSQALILNGIITDYKRIANKLYPQFASMLSYYANKKTKKYKFSFTFDGSIYPFEREYRRKSILELADKGLTLPPQYWASVYGEKPQNFKRALEEAHNIGMNENYITPLINMATMNSTALLNNNSNDKSMMGTTQTEDNKPHGRPSKDSGTLTDAGANNRNYGNSNV